MQHKVTIEPIRVRYWNRELAVESLRIVAYRGICSCGARGPRCLGRAAARKAFAAEHGAT